MAAIKQIKAGLIRAGPPLARAGSVLLAGAALALGLILAARLAGGTLPRITPIGSITPAPIVDDALKTVEPVEKGRWKYIVVHHSASFTGSAEIFDAWHRQKGWRGLGYHFVIGNGAGQGDGLIVAGPRWIHQEDGAHANSRLYNEHGIGICLVGNFDERPPTPAQMSAIRTLIRELCRMNNIPPENIFGHNQVRAGGGTACPGKLFNLEALKAGL